MTSLAVFGNFRIDSTERLQRMKDSLLSFKEINASHWAVNVRGEHKGEAKRFLAEHLGDRLILFELESGEGWFHDSRIMAKSLVTDYVLYWIEDHLNLLTNLSAYDDILTEMQSANVEFMYYSWFWATKDYELVQKTDLKNISWLDLTLKSFKLVQKKFRETNPEAGAQDPYIVGCTGIFSVDLFRRIMFSEDERQAFKWPRETPFDFEKSAHDRHWLPLRVGVPKYELFASIDDDSIAPGSSLISRGLYPARERRLGCPSISPIRFPKQRKRPRKKQLSVVERICRKGKSVLKCMVGTATR